MTEETVEQLKDRLRKEDKAKGEAFRKTLQEIRDGQAEWRAEQEAKKRAEEAKRQKLLEDARLKREREMKGAARVSWLSAGGTEEEFEQEWPGMRTEMLKRRTIEDDANARASQRRSGVSSF